MPEQMSDEDLYDEMMKHEKRKIIHSKVPDQFGG